MESVCALRIQQCRAKFRQDDRLNDASQVRSVVDIREGFRSYDMPFSRLWKDNWAMGSKGLGSKTVTARLRGSSGRNPRNGSEGVKTASRIKTFHLPDTSSCILPQLRTWLSASSPPFQPAFLQCPILARVSDILDIRFFSTLKYPYIKQNYTDDEGGVVVERTRLNVARSKNRWRFVLNTDALAKPGV